MKKTGLWLALVLAACALPVIPAPPLSAADDTILFGAAISITGKTAKEGEYTRDGYQFAIDKLNELGGVKVGGKTYKLALKYYDDETKPERTAQLIEKLINEDKVNLILGPYGSSPTVNLSRSPPPSTSTIYHAAPVAHCPGRARALPWPSPTSSTPWPGSFPLARNQAAPKTRSVCVAQPLAHCASSPRRNSISIFARS